MFSINLVYDSATLDLDIMWERKKYIWSSEEIFIWIISWIISGFSVIVWETLSDVWDQCNNFQR